MSGDGASTAPTLLQGERRRSADKLVNANKHREDKQAEYYEKEFHTELKTLHDPTPKWKLTVLTRLQHDPKVQKWVNKVYQQWIKTQEYEMTIGVTMWLSLLLPLVFVWYTLQRGLENSYPDLYGEDSLNWRVDSLTGEKYFVEPSWFQVVMPRFLTAVLWMNYRFIVIHLYVHCTMLEGFQCSEDPNDPELKNRNLILLPFAFFHHYCDPRLYSLRAFEYRFACASPVILASCACSWLTGYGDPVCTMLHIPCLYMDLCAHEWYHTADCQYDVTWNPFSTKFVGVNYFFKVCQFLGITNKHEHKVHHHRERAENQHLTGDWIDYKLPGLSTAFDYVANFMYAVFQKCLLGPIRGTHLPQLVEGCGPADASRWQFWITWLWVMPNFFWVDGYAWTLTHNFWNAAFMNFGVCEFVNSVVASGLNSAAFMDVAAKSGLLGIYTQFSAGQFDLAAFVTSVVTYAGGVLSGFDAAAAWNTSWEWAYTSSGVFAGAHLEDPRIWMLLFMGAARCARVLAGQPSMVTPAIGNTLPKKPKTKGSFTDKIRGLMIA